MRSKSYQSSDDGRVLVTGGAGYIGSHVVRELTEAGRRVRVLELPSAQVDHLPLRVELLRGDIRRARDVDDAVDGCAVVLHLAADPNLWLPNAADFDQINHQGTRHVLDAAARAGVRRVVHVSTESILVRRRDRGTITASARLHPHEAIGAYCRSKVRAEQLAWQAAQRGVPVVVVNPSVPVGPGDRRRGPLTRMIYDLLRGRTRGFFLDGQINLIDVRDVAAGVCAAALRGQAGRRYLLANETWEIRRLLDTLAKMAGMPAPRWAAPYPLALAFAWLEELWCRHVSGRQPMATVTGVRLTRRSFAMDGSSSLAALGVRPHAVIHALFETVMQLRASMDQQAERCPVVEEAVA